MANQRQLKGVVTVNHPDRTEHLILYPGDEYPDWAGDIFDKNPDVYYEPEEGDPGYSQPVSTGAYDGYKVHELVNLCRDRGVEAQSSKKADLLAALEEADAGNG